MIAAIAFSILGGWMFLSVFLARRIPRWLNVTKHRTAISVLLFPVVLVAPIADDLIGRWQFYRLCDQEAVVTLSPDWEKVKRARHNDDPITEIGGYAVPILVQEVSYVDMDTEKTFLNFKAFHTSGGFLQRHLYGLGGTTSCWPKDWIQVTNKLNTDQLIKQGKTK